MLLFHNNSADTRVEDSVFNKKLQAGCPLPESQQGTGRLVHYGVTSAPTVCLLAAAAGLGAEYVLLTECVLPVARVPAAFVPSLLLGGLVSSWMANAGLGARRMMKTSTARLSKAEQDAARSRFPLTLRLMRWAGLGMLTGIAVAEGWMWMHGVLMRMTVVPVPLTTVLGVLCAWAGLLWVHCKVTGPALWVLASGWLRWQHLWRQRRHEKLEDASHYVHGWRASELLLSLRATDASTQRHHLVFMGINDDGLHEHRLFTFGNFDGDQAAELLANQREAVKGELATALEGVLVHLLTQPPVSREAALNEEQVEAFRRRGFSNPPTVRGAESGKGSRSPGRFPSPGMESGTDPL